MRRNIASSFINCYVWNEVLDFSIMMLFDNSGAACFYVLVPSKSVQLC